ncbi:MAG: hypothetical protein ACO1QR_04880 [Chthoniobacteraceae bacterium]
MKSFPWPLLVGVIGFAVAFVVQFRLKHHVDREKVLRLEDLSELYPNQLPPRGILTVRGQQLYRWFYVGTGLFIASIIVTVIFFGDRAAE